MSAELIKLMLVDDHALVRAGIRKLLELDGRFQVVAEAGTAEEAIREAAIAGPDIVVMDVRLPNSSGIEACREIRASRPETSVIMLTSYPDDKAAVASVLAGASGYLLKELTEDAMVRSLLIVAHGGSLLQPELLGRALQQIRGETVSRKTAGLTQLTEKERHILGLLGEAMTNRQIAQALYLSENTIKHYVSRILEKLGLSRRFEAVAYLAKCQRESGFE